MRALIFAVLLLSSFALAKGVVVPDRHFSIEIQGKLSNLKTILFKDGKTWACQTEAMPYVEVKSDPLADLDWDRLAKEAQSLGPACREWVYVTDAREQPPKQLKTCRKAPFARRWLAQIDHACLR